MSEQITSTPKGRKAQHRNKPTGAAITLAVDSTTTALRVTKTGKVIALLKREQGATIEEMMKATSWQPHTTRAALTGLKKKGHTIERDKRCDVTCYRIAKNV